MNVLLTCAGRRNYLVRYFRDALTGSGRVVATDLSSDAPALSEADVGLTVPPVDNPQYVDILRDVCRDHHIGLLVPLNDLELPVIAAQVPSLRAAGVTPVVSSPDVVDICFDKARTADFLATKVGVRTPRTFVTLDEATAALETHVLQFPVVVKPRWGSASIGIEYPQDMDELQAAHRRLRRTVQASPGTADRSRAIVVQERVSGQEYGLDVVNDLQGRHVATFVKRKLGMRAGETDRAVTETHEELASVGERLGRALRHIGNLDCDAFVADGECVVLEMNPRIGGGYPFSHVAGANLPAAYLAWARGEHPDPSWLRVAPGVLASKYDTLAVMRPSKRP